MQRPRLIMLMSISLLLLIDNINLVVIGHDAKAALIAHVDNTVVVILVNGDATPDSVVNIYVATATIIVKVILLLLLLVISTTQLLHLKIIQVDSATATTRHLVVVC